MCSSDLADVRLTTRLTESAACLVADGGAVNAHLERMMEKMGRDTGANKRVLELNPANAAVVALKDRHAANAADPRLEGYAKLLYEQSLIAEGSSLPDPVAFAKRVNDLIARDAG